MNRNDILLQITSVAITLVITLLLIRWLAPTLLGIPSDLALVQLKEERSAFYDGVFEHTGKSSEFMVPDPIVKYRAMSLYPEDDFLGPNDLLGFRNHSVPNRADVVVIGDSQTYGNNASIENNWPHAAQRLLGSRRTRVYTMAIGGWGALQYLSMAEKAMAFRPTVMVVAFYTGNDSLESFSMAYGSSFFDAYRLDRELGPSDHPRVPSLYSTEGKWQARFSDGFSMFFTPAYRLIATRPGAVQDAGFKIMARVAREISDIATRGGATALFTVIPTKELVYCKKIRRSGMEMPEVYFELCKWERERIDVLRGQIAAFSPDGYVDVLGPLETAALSSTHLYPENVNGHPERDGYQVIAAAVSARLTDLLPSLLIPQGVVAVMDQQRQTYRIILVSGFHYWIVNDPDLLKANGWPEGDIPDISAQTLSRLDYAGVLEVADPSRYSPENLHLWVEKMQLGQEPS